MSDSFQVGNALLLVGDCLQRMQELPAQSVHCVVTSPPYWNLRDYKHEQQIGMEKTPGEFVAKMVEVGRGVRRVMRDDAVFWLNLGDSYLQGGQLAGLPWRVALALQADGWILRQEIIWDKKAPMPESVQNRCTKSHEQVFLLVKKMGYFYDAEAIKEKLKGKPHAPGNKKVAPERNDKGHLNEHDRVFGADGKANKRSVWRVSTQGFPGSHFATFPRKLITPMILAGTSQKGCCADCGAPYKRITEKTKLKRDRPNDYVKRKGEQGTGNSCANSVAGVDTKTLGWEKSCTCKTDAIVPCTVLDPFAGAFTTCLTSELLGRKSIGIELNPDYVRMGLKRLKKRGKVGKDETEENTGILGMLKKGAK